MIAAIAYSSVNSNTFLLVLSQYRGRNLASDKAVFVTLISWYHILIKRR